MPELLELRDHLGAFERIEAWLTERGFFTPGGEALAADLYLGFGLSQAIRRDPRPSPPEPCAALPLAACRLAEESHVSQRHTGFRIGEWEQTWTAAEYGAAVEEVRAAIGRGDVYQVNLVQHLQAPFSGDPRALGDCLAPLRPLQPAPFVTDTWAVVSASPELFLSRRSDVVRTMPIKGTRPRGGRASFGPRRRMPPSTS